MYPDPSGSGVGGNLSEPESESDWFERDRRGCFAIRVLGPRISSSVAGVIGLPPARGGHCAWARGKFQWRSDWKSGFSWVNVSHLERSRRNQASLAMGEANLLIGCEILFFNSMGTLNDGVYDCSEAAGVSHVNFCAQAVADPITHLPRVTEGSVDTRRWPRSSRSSEFR